MRRAVCVLLIALQLLLPGLTVAHAHDEVGQGSAGESDELRTPSRSSAFHVHILPFGPAHHHSHHHHGHKHEVDDQGSATDSSQSDDSNAPDSPLDEHDQNACYGQFAIVIGGIGKVSIVPAMGKSVTLILNWTTLGLWQKTIDDPDTSERAPLPEGIVCAPSPLYLSTLHLLI